jgi:hypothetical protein
MERYIPARGTSASDRSSTLHSHFIRGELFISTMQFVARRLHKEIASTKKTLMNNEFESTYALLVRSEDKGRGVLETIVYAAFILSAIFSIWQFATQSPIRIPARGLEPRVAWEMQSAPAAGQS